MMPNEPAKNDTLKIVLIVAAMLIGNYAIQNWRGRQPVNPDDPKPVSVNVQALVAKAEADKREKVAACFEDAAKRVESGEIKTSTELFKDLSPCIEAAKTSAYGPVNEHMNTIPRDKDDLKPEAVKFLRDLGTAIKRAK